MNWAYDSTKDFYYMGSEPAYPGIYQDKIGNAPRLISVDTETISLKEHISIGVGIATSPSCAFYFPLFPQPSPATPWHLLRDPAYTKIFHNALFDLFCTREFEWDMSNIRDTNIMARLLCYPFTGLQDMSQVHKMEVHNAGDMLIEAKARTMLDLPKDVVAKKCMMDVMATFKLYHELLPRVDLPYFLTEMEVIPILLKMSFRGIKLDQELRSNLEEYYGEEVEYLRKLCDDAEGFNPGSTQQSSYILAKRGAYKVFTKLPFTRARGKHNLSSAKEILQRMDDPLANIILTYRSKNSLLTDYLIPWGRDDRASTRFHMDAATGRPSSTERNLQNIPSLDPLTGWNVRNVFLPDSAMWTDADFSQLELRCLAHISGDKEMQYIFSLPKFNEDGTPNLEADIHQQTANFMGIKRKLAKNVNFAMIYGATDQTIAETAEIRDIHRAGQLKAMWFQKFPQAGDWIEATQGQAISIAAEGGLTYAPTIFGRKLRLPSLDEDSVDGIGRKSINYPIQGSAAEILKRGLIRCKDWDMALTVHDEVLFDGYVSQEWIQSNLEHIAMFYTPTEVKYLVRWE